MAIGFVLSAFFLFLIGSTATARGAAVVSRTCGFSPMTIGLLAIAAATATPTLFVLWRANSVGAIDLAVGGVIGGVILALTFLLGLCAYLRPLECPPKVMGRDLGALLIASLCFLVLSVLGVSSRLAGFVLLCVFAGYMTVTFVSDWRRAAEHSVARAHAESLDIGNLDLSGGVFLAALGVIAVMLGAHLSVTGSLALAWQLGFPPYAMGLTLVAACVAAPAFLVAFAGGRRSRGSVLVGYAVILGIFDLACMFGLFMLLFPAKVSNVFVVDGVVLAGICALLPLIAAVHWRLSRQRGILLMAGYGVYLVVLLVRLNLLSHFWPQV